MKLFALLMVGSSLSLLTQAGDLKPSENKMPKPILSKAEQKQVLATIDNNCADTWCEGDFSYDFKSFTCEATSDGDSCELDFTMSTTDGVSVDENTEGSLSQTRAASCVFSNIKKSNDVVSDDFMDRVGNCIGKLEEVFSR